jgi:hypothetical protein
MACGLIAGSAMATLVGSGAETGRIRATCSGGISEVTIGNVPAVIRL